MANEREIAARQTAHQRQLKPAATGRVAKPRFCIVSNIPAPGMSPRLPVSDSLLILKGMLCRNKLHIQVTSGEVCGSTYLPVSVCGEIEVPASGPSAC